MSEEQYSGPAVFGAVVLAAGSGSRMNGNIAKQYLPLEGRPLIYYALRAFEQSAVARIVLVVAEGHEAYCRKEIVERFGFTRVCAVVAGGRERYFSVQAGLRALCGVDYVLIHDGARPFVDQAMITRTMEAVQREQAVVVGMPVKDTIKVVDGHRRAVQTPDRRTLWQMQTPQAFSYQLIRDAYDAVLAGLAPESGAQAACGSMSESDASGAQAVHGSMSESGVQAAHGSMSESDASGAQAACGSMSVDGSNACSLTDDAQVLELAYGKKCRLIEGSYRNIKVTTPEDLEIARVFCKYGSSGPDC